MYRGQRPEAIDTRIVFRIYAALACFSGLVLAGWGPIWLGADLYGQPWARSALIRVFGSLLIAAGCCAVGFAAVSDPPSRHRGLLWFAVGHTVVWLAVLVQQITVWGPGLAERAAQVLWIPVFVLFYLWFTVDGDHVRGTLISLFDDEAPGPSERLRSQYEQQIRQAVAQEERNRLARDLHDSIKQQIFVIQTATATAQVRFDGDPRGARQALDQVRNSAREAMTEMEAMLDQLHAVPLENAGLIEALKKQCEALGFRTGARVDFKLGVLPPSRGLAPGVHQAILRVAQEALANVGRHARARNVLVSLESVPNRVEFRIQDDGAGFDPVQKRPGMGTANMRARAQEFDGEFELASRPGGGTAVKFLVPYNPESPREYREKAVMWGALLVFSTLVLVWNGPIGMVCVPVVAAIGLARYMIAYRCAQEQSEVAP